MAMADDGPPDLPAGALFHERYVWSPSFLQKKVSILRCTSSVGFNQSHLGLSKWVMVNNTPRRIHIPPTTT